MAKSAPSLTMSGTPSERVLELVFKDFRGQKVTKRIGLGAGVLAADITAIVGHIDMITNALIITARVLDVTEITGMNTNSADPGMGFNALERNISEQMELTFQVVDPINATKTIARSILIPAMIAGIELKDGTPDVTNTDLAALIGTATAYNDGDLSSKLFYKDGGGSGHTGMNFIVSDSHHLTTADIVDAQ
jgi:hypothetical protein